MMAEGVVITDVDAGGVATRWDKVQDSKACVTATWIISVIPPVIFTIYVAQFGINVPQADEWTRVPLVTSALEGHLSLSAVWSQWLEYRLPVPNLVFIVDGYVAHFSSRSLMFFDAAIFTIGYYGVLLVYRQYTAGRLNPINVVVLASVWFSLANAQNALWGFVVAWYVIPACFIWMVFSLMMPKSHHWLWFTLAAILAVCASYSMIQGFLLWPIGILCLLWVGPWTRRTAIRVSAWLGIGVVTAGLYFIGFNFKNLGCPGCSDSFSFSHPASALHWLTVLVGNIVPTGFYQDYFQPSFSTGWQELTGILVLVAAVAVVVQSLRERSYSQRPPLPLLLVIFGFLFDLMITYGRVSIGVLSATSNRYEMPNLLIFLGIVAFALAHLPSPKRPPSGQIRQWVIRWMATVVVFGFLVTQVWVSTSFAIESGRLSRIVQTTAGRVVVNLDRIPSGERSCALYALVWQGLLTPQGALAYSTPIINGMALHHLGLFEPGTYARLRAAGPPIIPGNCSPPMSSSAK